jgi:hypothetical protein
MPDRVTRAMQEYLELESNIGGYEAAALQSEASGIFMKPQPAC